MSKYMLLNIESFLFNLLINFNFHFEYFQERLVPSVRSVDLVFFLLLTEAAVRR